MMLSANVYTDQADYPPGATAHIFASDFAVGEAVQFQVLHTDGMPNTSIGHQPWTVVDGSADDLDGKVDGNVHTTWYVDPDDSAGASFNLTAQGSSSGLSSSTTFTDGNPAINIEQWKSLSAIWSNGQANSVQSKYLEGDVVPYWLEANNLTVGTTYGVRINLDYYQSTTDAGGFLYLDTYNRSIAGVTQNPGDGTGGPLPALSADNTFAFTDPLYANPGLKFYVYNADVVSVAYSTSANGLTRFADVRFTPTAANENDGEATVNIYWGERLALPNEVITSANPDANSKGAAGFTGGSLQNKIAGTGAAGTTWITPSNAVQLMTGVVVQGSISGYKWNDLDGQGDKDANEPGLAGWTIQLYKDDGDNVFDAGDALVDSKVTADGLTDANGDGSIDALDLGFYKFAPVLRGTYFVKEVPQAGWTQTFPSNNLYGPLAISEVTSNYTNENFGNVRSAPAIKIIKYVNGDDANSAPGIYVGAGSTLTFTYVVTNTGNVAIKNLAVSDDVLGTITSFAGDANNNGLLDTSETWTYTKIATALAGQHTNVGTVTGNDNITNAQVTDNNLANYFGSAPSIKITKYVDDANGIPRDADTAAGGPILSVGSTANFSYEVRNSGNVDLSDVAVSDDHGLTLTRQSDLVGNNDSTLNVGETWLFTASAPVTAGQYTNNGDVTAQDPIGTQVSDRDPANYYGSAPAIEITKYVNGNDADTIAGEPILQAGSTATFTYTVNIPPPGNVPLSNVVVVDDNGTPGDTSDDFNPTFTGGDANNNGQLDLGETWTYMASATVTAGQYTNNGDVTAQDPIGTQVSDRDPANYYGSAPSIKITKYVNDANGIPQDADTAAGGPILSVGSTANFSYEVRNSGNVDLSDVVVSDDHGLTLTRQSDLIGNNDNTLNVGEKWLFTASATVTAGPYTNYGYVTAQDSIGTPVEDQDPAHYFGKPNIIVIGPDKGNTSCPIVKIVDKDTGDILKQFYVYEPNFLGGVRIATGDMDGDGIDEIIVAPGQGRVGEVRVFTQDGVELTQFRTQPYGSSFTGGVEIAVGDVNGDGKNDIVTTPSHGRTEVRVFYNNYDSMQPLVDPIANSPDKQFFVFPSSFLGGADVAVANVAGDLKDEIIVGNGPGMRSMIFVYDATGAQVGSSILPFSNSFKGGITLSTARINADAIPDFVVASGIQGGSAIETWDGLTHNRLAAFSAFGNVTSKNAPVHATTLDTDGDGIADIIAAVQGTNGASNQIRFFNTSGGQLSPPLNGFVGPWNIASLTNVDLNLLIHAAAVDQVFCQCGDDAPATLKTKKPPKHKKH